MKMKFLKLYENFQQENILLESVLVYSDRFSDILNKIGDEISQEVLNLKNQDYPNSKICYLDIADENNLSFETDSKNSNRTQLISIGRMINKLLSLTNKKITDKQRENFVNKFKALMKTESDFKIFSGDEIYKYYSIIPYEKETGVGQLGKSCMNKKPKKFFDLYTKNPDKINILVLFRDGEMVGRSILWNTDNGFKFMDRIYTYKDSDIDLFKFWGDENGYFYKVLQNTSYMSRDNFFYRFDIKNKDQTKNEEIVVSLDNFEVSYYPYLDSLCYFNSKTGQISNHRFKIDADLLICNMDGGSKSSDFEWVFD
jgi:hypothetical protein